LERRGKILMGNKVSFLGKFSLKQKKQGYIIYIGIAFTVIFFNLIAIFGLESLMHDDPAWYKMVLSGAFPRGMLKYNLISPFTEWIGWNIMAYSPKLARGLYVLLLMVPISCCFYYLCRSRFGFSRMTAFAAAVLPVILPQQWEVPAGINMSYVLWGMLFSLLSFLLGIHYLGKNTPNNWARLTGAFISYLVATQIMEQALFLYPPFVLAFWGYNKFDKKNLRIIIAFSLVSAAKLVQILLYTRKAMQWTPLGEIIDRVGLYFQWALPVPEIPPVFAAIIFLAIILGGGILYSKHAVEETTGETKSPTLFSHFPLKSRGLFFYGFFIGWSIITVSPAIVLSFFYTIRYAYISLFGAIAIFFFSLHTIILKLFPGREKGKRVYIPFFLILVIISGAARYFYLRDIFDLENTNQAVIKRSLDKIKLPLHAQVVIVGIEGVGYKGFDGGWERSSGYLQFALKRKDLKGLISPCHSSAFYNFDNHFDPGIRGWRPRYYMTGLSPDQPVFLFRLDKKTGELNQYEYALQWEGTTSKARWTILRFDKITGKAFPLTFGRGIKEYLLEIEKLGKMGIRQSDILWGGPPTKSEQIRLEKGN
jgi:hypothetical protein